MKQKKPAWFKQAQELIAYRIGEWRRRRENPDPLPGMTEAEVKAYYLGHQREAEAMIDLLSAISRGEDVAWAKPAATPDKKETATKQPSCG